jgi:uncharacterized membrane protein
VTHWHLHPGVRTGADLTFGERAADRMKSVFATWTALGAILLAMTVWIITAGFGADSFPYILLNLCLSCLAALQCFILLIAARRADQIASEIALHTLDNTAEIQRLVSNDTVLTEAVSALTTEVHQMMTQVRDAVVTKS